MSKYRNTKVKIGKYKFDSIAEGRRYKELALLERAGIINNLELQPRFYYKKVLKRMEKHIGK